MAAPKALTCVIGVDVGGTNTDCVVLCKNEVIGLAKSVTTDDVTICVSKALYGAVNDAIQKGHVFYVSRIHIGTTHFVNAVVQRKNLAKIAVIRLCGPASRALPPFSDFPPDLKETICSAIYMVNGGYQYDGADITTLDSDEIKKCAQELKDRGIKNVVVSGIFSAVNPEQELQAGAILQAEYPDLSITLSHRIGQLGLLERENAAILNESLKPISHHTIGAFREALDQLGFNCPFYLTQNDGTLISAERALEQPVRTFSSGPTNSMRGAAFLSGVQNAIVIDIGGTTSDFGMLEKGFPKEASYKVKVGGVHTNFHMPDVLSIGLGGGSKVIQKSDNSGNLVVVSVGPESVGYNLQQEAKIFGGSTLTTTDVAVAAGLADIGSSANVTGLSQELITKTMDEIRNKIIIAIDQVKVCAGDIPVVLVGGGSVLIDTDQPIPGVSHMVKPPNFDVANAVGAALSQVSGQVDQTVKLEVKGAEGLSKEESKRQYTELRQSAYDRLIQEAIEDAVKRGALRETVKITEESEVQLAYIPGNATRIKIKAVGDMKQPNISDTMATQQPYLSTNMLQLHSRVSRSDSLQADQSIEQDRLKDFTIKEITVSEQPPLITPEGEWVLSKWDIECISIGAGIYGCGGGGSPYLGRLLALKAIDEGKKIRIVTPERLSKTLGDDDVISTIAFMGAPMIFIEKLVSGTETMDALKCHQELYSVGGYKDGVLQKTDGVKIESMMGVDCIENYQPVRPPGVANLPVTDTRIAAVMSAEIGGMNSIEPLLVAAKLDLPVVDCDGMGRAFPELQMFIPFICGHNPDPSCLTDDLGKRSVILKSESSKHVEDYFRMAVGTMGLTAGVTFAPMNREQVQTMTVQYSYSRVWKMGNAVLRARKAKISPVEAITTEAGGTLLCCGKITDVQRRTGEGFTRGLLTIEGFDDWAGQCMQIEFQNEMLVAKVLLENGKSEVKACTPDLITMVDSSNGDPVPTEELRYGLRVSVLALPCTPHYRTEKGLAVVGPRAFKYPEEIQYVPLPSNWGDVEPIGPR